MIRTWLLSLNEMMSNVRWKSSDAESPVEKTHVYVMKGVLASQFVRYVGSSHKMRSWESGCAAILGLDADPFGILVESGARVGNRLPRESRFHGLSGSTPDVVGLDGRAHEGADIEV